jgi:hypothetical protein
MLDKESKRVGETIVNFWLQMAGAAAQGLSAATREHQKQRTSGEKLDSSDLAYVVALGLREALDAGREAAGIAAQELFTEASASSNGTARKGKGAAGETNGTGKSDKLSAKAKRL